MHVINEQRQFSIDDIEDMLGRIMQMNIKDPYPCVTELSTSAVLESSGIRYIPTSDILARERSHPNIKCIIGAREIYDNKDEKGLVRDIDFVWAVKHIFHEAHHLNLIRNVYQTDLSGRNLDSARIDAVMCLFDGYKQQIYRYAPSEIDADIYGFEETVKWFDENLSIIDARECCVLKIRELEFWRGDKGVKNYDNIVKSLERIRESYSFIPRDRVFNECDAGLMNEIDNKCPKWMSEIEKIQNGEIKNYEDVDRLLFSVALDINSSWIDRHAGLDKEVKSVRKQYPSKLKSGDKIVSSISRIFNMRDTSELSDDEQETEQDDEFEF